MALGKPLQELGLDDIQALIDDTWPESDRLELKQFVPARKGERDRWYRDQQAVSEHGRNELLAEVVAFANSQGGDLVIGMAETTDRPARAAHIELVPACIELAHRLELMARDCIEPAIPLLAARGIPTADNGAGVVIVRVPPSRAAPHRLMQTRECYHRRRDRTEKMTMREIQDLTFAVARGTEAVEQRLQDLRDEFHTLLTTRPIGHGCARLAIGLSAVPTTLGLSAPSVQRRPSLAFRARDYRLRFSNGGEAQTRTNVSAGPLRPILRGARSAYLSEHRGQWFSLWADGAIGWWWHIDSDQNAMHQDRPAHRLYANWLAGDALNVADWADRYRQEAGAAATEYALRIEIVSSAELAVFGLRNDPFGNLGELPAGTRSFPTYSVGGTDERPDLVSAVLIDLWNLVGEDFGDASVAAIEPVGP